MCTSTRRPRTIQSIITPLPTLEKVTPKRTESSKKSVSFAPNLKIRFSLSLEDYSNDEYDACWYSSEEYQAIEKDMCRQFMRLEQGKVFHDVRSCSRGLEKYLTKNAIPKMQNHTKACQAVLDEQSRQAIMGESDEEAIARLYNNVSSSCQMWAAVLGLRDQRDAEKYNQDDWHDLEEALMQSQESQELPIQQDYIAPQRKSHDTNITMSPMTEIRHVAVSARTA